MSSPVSGVNIPQENTARARW